MAEEVVPPALPPGPFPLRADALKAWKGFEVKEGMGASIEDWFVRTPYGSVLKCPSAFMKGAEVSVAGKKGQKRSVWKPRLEDSLQVTRFEGESSRAFKARKGEVLQGWAEEEELCAFRVSVFKKTKAKETTWDFKDFIPHSEDCTERAFIAYKHLADAMRGVGITAGSRDWSYKGIVSRLCAVGTQYSSTTLPCTSSIHRAANTIRFEEDQWNDVYWNRMYFYLKELGEQNEGILHVKLKRIEATKEFEWYVIGFKMNMELMKSVGLGFYAADACHSKHHIARSLVLLFLVGRTGNNNNVILAVGHFMRETKEAYTQFALECRTMGFDILARGHPGIKPVW